MDEIQKALIKAGRKDLAQKYYEITSNLKVLPFTLTKEFLEDCSTDSFFYLDLAGNPSKGYTWRGKSIGEFRGEADAFFSLYPNGVLYAEAQRFEDWYKSLIENLDDLKGALSDAFGTDWVNDYDDMDEDAKSAYEQLESK